MVRDLKSLLARHPTTIILYMEEGVTGEIAISVEYKNLEL